MAAADTSEPHEPALLGPEPFPMLRVARLRKNWLMRFP